MNKSQKRIVVCAFTVTGLFMVAGAVINSLPVRLNPETLKLAKKYGITHSFGFESFFKELLISPIFYVGVALIVAGLVIIKGRKKTG